MKLTFTPRLLLAPTTTPPGGLDPAAARELAKAMKEMDSDVNYFYDSLKNVTRELTNQTDISKDIAKNYRQLSKIADQLKYDQEDISKLGKKDLESLVKKLSIQKTSLEQNKTAALARVVELKAINNLTAKQAQELERVNKAYEEAESLIDDQDNGLKKLVAVAQERLELEEKIDKAMGLSGAAVRGMIGGLNKLGVSSKYFDNVEKKMRSAAENGSKWETFMAGSKEMASGLGEALSDPLFEITAIVKIAKFFIDAMFAADKEATDLSRNLIISKEAARGVLDRFEDIKDSINSGKSDLAKMPENMTILRKELEAAQVSFNSMFGLAVDFTDKTSVANQRLGAQLGILKAMKGLELTDEELKGFATIYAQTGKQAQDVEKSTLGTATVYKMQTGYQIDQKKVLKDVLTTSNALKLSIKGGTEALNQSVINAQHLGISLQKSEDIAEGMLNFESSIQSQLEAELLTGREINLNKLRYAALTGDQVMMTEELNKLVTEAGPDFEKNILAQQAVAKALGVSRAELADMVTQQKLLNATKSVALNLSDKEKDRIIAAGHLSDSMAKQLKQGTMDGVQLFNVLKDAGYSAEKMADLFGKQAEAVLANESAQDKFNKALENAKEKFVALNNNGTLDKLADLFQDLVKSITNNGMFSTLFGSGIEKERRDRQETAASATLTQYQGVSNEKLTPEQRAEIDAAHKILQERVARDQETQRESIQSEKRSRSYKADMGDFTINPLPEDTITASGGNSGITIQGGTRLGRTDEMVAELKEQNRILMAILAKDTTIKVDGQALANTVGVNVPVSYGNLLNPGSSTYYS